MPRKRAGSVLRRRGAWWARVVFIDASGARREKWRRADTRAAATDLRDELIRELDDRGLDAFENRDRTFAELADRYEEKHAKPAEYRDGAKVAGLRSFARVKGQLATLREHFGNCSLRSVRYADLDELRTERLAQPVKFKHHDPRPRSIADVNRLLALLRRMLNFAVQSGWLIANPFATGPALVRIAEERKRERILSRAEERALLAKCSGSRRRRLRAVLITLLDTGLRKGELMKLIWTDIDLKSGKIHVQAMNAKTLRAREVPITARVRVVLEDMRKRHSGRMPLVFGVKDNVRTSFEKACAECNVAGLRFHDLRHTAGTRMIEGGLSIAEVARILGHSQLSTAYRYVNAHDDTLRRAAEALERTHREAEKRAKAEARAAKRSRPTPEQGHVATVN
jgi:integrase